MTETDQEIEDRLLGNLDRIVHNFGRCATAFERIAKAQERLAQAAEDDLALARQIRQEELQDLDRDDEAQSYGLNLDGSPIT